MAEIIVSNGDLERARRFAMKFSSGGRPVLEGFWPWLANDDTDLVCWARKSTVRGFIGFGGPVHGAEWI